MTVELTSAHWWKSLPVARCSSRLRLYPEGWLREWGTPPGIFIQRGQSPWLQRDTRCAHSSSIAARATTGASWWTAVDTHYSSQPMSFTDSFKGADCGSDVNDRFDSQRSTKPLRLFAPHHSLLCFDCQNKTQTATFVRLHKYLQWPRGLFNKKEWFRFSGLYRE